MCCKWNVSNLTKKYRNIIVVFQTVIHHSNMRFGCIEIPKSNLNHYGGFETSGFAVTVPLIASPQQKRLNQKNKTWLVVSTHLTNISPNGNLPQVGAKIKNIYIYLKSPPNHMLSHNRHWIHLLYQKPRQFSHVFWQFLFCSIPKRHARFQA